ncbi:P-loop containing nucleoside triphosphate hydrolase protein [Neolentinus lepideus HHB14362 ss-1]|uniref:RNA helicase n=1 Tax=Neolentinus lepideus HHB14362 ss-1 TaxID=1314782 RepID=A0A165W371_9AGAM|nr:P-loop containing nucleoside triphosphate hydrolase protein [Neolentinus lepideus HHB14362 ss-1]
MQFLSRTSCATLAALSARRSLQAHSSQYCAESRIRNITARPYSINGTSGKEVLTFEDIGIHPIVVESLRRAFPNVQNPTDTQCDFIPQVLSGKDVLLKDDTGTGKSFGLMLALLSKSRAPRANGIGRSEGSSDKAAITSLVLVPHRDLAYQLHYWIEAIVSKSISPPSFPPTVVQTLVRGASVSIQDQISKLHEMPPHVLIGTPQAVQEVFDGDRNALQLDTLSTVVVDEVDYLIDAVPRHASGYKQEKLKKKIQKHPGPTRELLNYIYDRKRMSVTKGTEGRGPQLIMTSATFRVGHREEVLKSGWLQGQVVKVTGTLSMPSSVDSKDGTPSHSPGLVHHGLVVSQDGRISNIEGAVEPQSQQSDDIRSATEFPDEVFQVTDEDTDETFQPKLDSELRKKFVSTPSPFNPALLEAVSAAFALDVPRLALLVLPAEASVKRAVFELQQLGVSAIALDLLGDKGRTYLLNGDPHAPADTPTLLVSTLASTRGLDLPELSHVFILGVPEDRRVDNYLHIAGRAGRFGRGGKVVTVLEERREVTFLDGKRIVLDDPKRLAVMLKEIGCVATKFEHFD